MTNNQQIYVNGYKGYLPFKTDNNKIFLLLNNITTECEDNKIEPQKNKFDFQPIDTIYEQPCYVLKDENEVLFYFGEEKPCLKCTIYKDSVNKILKTEFEIINPLPYTQNFLFENSTVSY